MKQNQKKGLALLLGVCLIAGSLAGCGADGTSPSASGGGSTQKLSVVGSTSVAPLAKELMNGYASVAPEIQIDIQAVGSSAGVKATEDGSADIGMASRELKSEESAAGVTATEIAYDGIAVVVNPKNEVGNLSKNQIQQIFKGEITNWKEVGGKDAEIVVISREEGSGTRTAFEEILKLEQKQGDKTISALSAEAQVADSNGSVKSGIASKENAIGYLSLGIVDSTVKALSVDNVACSAQTVIDKTYAISRPLLMLTKGEAQGEAKKFLEYILSDAGQTIVAKEFIPVSK